MGKWIFPAAVVGGSILLGVTAKAEESLNNPTASSVGVLAAFDKSAQAGQAFAIIEHALYKATLN